MKKQILTSLISLSSVLTMIAQIYTPSSIIQGSSGNNNVGIGATNPQSKLTLPVNSYVGFQFSENNDNVYHKIGRDYTNYVYALSYISTGADRQTDIMHNFQTGNGSAMVITESGNIGLGVTAPQSKLTLPVNSYIGFQFSSSNNSVYHKIGRDYTNYIYALSYISTGADRQTDIMHNFQTGNGSALVILENKKVGIGTITPGYELDVIGTIRAREIKVDLNGADFVFEKGYKLMPISELERFVKEQKHLPEIAPAKEMKNNGTDLGNLNSKLLQKMEEMTLYMIEQNKKIEELRQVVKLQSEEIEKLKAVSR